MIYEIRNTQVMLDSDLAKLYECKNGTKSINLAVKRHIDRFPIRFMFQLSDREMNELRFQVETSISRGRRYNPYVFTEQGVAMLSTILKTGVAVQVSISIMDAFVNMRKYIGNNLIEQKYINNQVLKNTDDIKKYNSQYNNLSVYFNNTFHDRYIIIDEKIVYHLGTSLNHAGSKTFSINILNDIDIINLLIKNVKKCIKNLPKV